MALAIQHFNAKHERELKGWGAEHKFMITVLEAVDSAIPLLRRFSKPAVASGLPFLSLWTAVHRSYDGNPAKIAQQDTLSRMASLIGRSCPRDSVVQRWYRMASHGSSLIALDSMRYGFGEDGPEQACQSPIAAAVLRYGLRYLTSASLRYDDWMQSFQLSVGVSTLLLRDMAYVRRQMIEDSATVLLAKRLQVRDLDTDLVMPPWDILLVGSSGNASWTEPVRLRYSWRSGDCNPGCPERHAWIVEVTSPAEKTVVQAPSYKRLKVQVLREEGAALTPEEQRIIRDGI